MHTSKRKMWTNLSINVLLLFFPVFLIINGEIGLAQNSVYHPDAFVLLGLLILGVLGLAMTGLTIFRLSICGWKGLTTYQKGIAIFYFVCLLIGGYTWLLFTEAVPPEWNFPVFWQ